MLIGLPLLGVLSALAEKHRRQAAAKPIFSSGLPFPLLVDQPVPSSKNGKFDVDSVTAIGDIDYDVMYGVTEKDGLLWAWGGA